MSENRPDAISTTPFTLERMPPTILADSTALQRMPFFYFCKHSGTSVHAAVEFSRLYRTSAHAAFQFCIHSGTSAHAAVEFSRQYRTSANAIFYFSKHSGTSAHVALGFCKHSGTSNATPQPTFYKLCNTTALQRMPPLIIANTTAF